MPLPTCGSRQQSTTHGKSTESYLPTSAVTSALFGDRGIHGRAQREPRPLPKVPAAGFTLVPVAIIALPLMVVVIGTTAGLLLTRASGTR